MARKGKKQEKRLAIRVKDWENIRDKVNAKDAEHPVSGCYMRKPGSLKKQEAF